MLAIKDLREDVRFAFAVLQNYIRPGGKFNLTDINVHAEDFICELLNEVYSWHLINANASGGNYPCIDLLEQSERIGIQVTSDNSSTKANRTIRCIAKHDLSKSIDHLKIFTLVPRQGSYTIKESCPGVAFTWRSDILDFDAILEMVATWTDVGRLQSVHGVVINALPSVFAGRRARLRELSSRLEKDVSIFDREVMRAPFEYEDPLEMYQAIREMRVSLQKNSSSYVPNEVAASNFAEIKDILRRVEYRVRARFPLIHAAAKRGSSVVQYDGTDWADAVNLMMGIRDRIKTLLDAVRSELQRINQQL